jgi:lipopolysaccharide export system permease protein
MGCAWAHVRGYVDIVLATNVGGVLEALVALIGGIRVFERYLAREIYASTLLVLSAFLALFAFFDLVNELGDLGKGNYQLHHAVGYVLLTLPGYVYELLPIAVLIGTLYALTLLARHSEITVLRASGLSTAALVGALLRIGALFVALTFLVGEFVAPPAERAAQQLRLQARSSVIGQQFRSGLWVKDEHAFVNVREVLPDASLRGIRIYQFAENYQLASISQAESGSFQPPNSWRLANVSQTFFEEERVRVASQAEVLWQSALSPDILTVLLVDPGRMSLVNLYLYTRHLSENRQKTQRYEIAMWKKIVYPAAALVMMILALPFGYLHDRLGNISLKVFSGVMLGVTFHMLNGLFSSLGVINSWPPLYAAITPSMLFLLLAAVMIWWVERR